MRAVGLGLLLFSSAGIAPAWAAPTAIKLSWASADASTTMAVTWITSGNTPTTIEYGVASTAEHSLTVTPPREIVGIGWHHEIELTSLSPNTTYRYRVGAPGDWSPEHTFKTAPNDQCTPFSFVQLGDARSQDSRGPSLNWPSIQQEAAAAGAAFFLNGGDLVREGTDIGQWNNWLQASEMVNPDVPMMPCIGNHDDGPGDGTSANYNQLFALPTNTVTGTEDYYAFVYNNLLVFSLSTQTYDDWAAQMAWLEGVAAQHPNKWKIVFFHHPVYTTQTRAFGIDVGHGPNEKGQNPFYGPAFDRAGIDLVIQSHNHIYERFQPLRYDPADPNEGQVVANFGNGPGEGRLYVVSGGSGAFLDPLIEGNFQSWASGSEMRSKDHHYIRMTIAGGTLQYAAVRTSAGNSSGGGTTIDTLTLTRPGPDPCAIPTDPDADRDGYPASRDCNDADASVNPGATEVCGNGKDEDCQAGDLACPPPPVDADGDGSPLGTDCDDQNPARYPEHPETECDGVDNDCDCLEVCAGQSTDLCAADAGPQRDAAAPVDAAPGADAAPAIDATPGADATSGADASPADLGFGPPLPDEPDAGSTPPAPPPAEGCGCTDTRPGPQLLSAAVLALALLRRRR